MSRAVIEREIPHPENDRRWCAEEFERKAWWVAEDHLDYVADLCAHYFGGVMVVGGEEGDEFRDGTGARSRQEGLFS